MSRIIINNISWAAPDGTTIFENLSACFNSEITALVGNNGLGKSTIARIICGEIAPASGSILKEGCVRYLPQNQAVFNGKPIYAVLGYGKKYPAFKRIIDGSGDESTFADLNNDWLVTEKIFKSLEKAGIGHIDPERSFDFLSGGEKVKTLIASLYAEDYDFVILDEPTNHLDSEGRNLIFNFVRNFGKGIIIISHDRELLQLADKTIELSNIGLTAYGGNYEFYREQREVEANAAEAEFKNAAANLKKSIIDKKTVAARQEKRIRAAEKNSENANIATIALHKRRGAGEKTAKKLLDIHERRIRQNEDEFNSAKQKLRENKKIIVDLENDKAAKNKTIIRAGNINFSYNGNENLWRKDLNFCLGAGERIAVSGKNGSGKSTLLKIIKGARKPRKGIFYCGARSIGFLDQHVSMLNDELSLLDNFKQCCNSAVPEHELRIRLGRFLFYKDEVMKKAGVLSGGERIRAGLALMLAVNKIPELILLDEPTNNLDLSAVLELTRALNEFKGCIVAVSHDSLFIESIGIEEEINLDEG
jgi:ATPase subunit of ABC transporter with duplicated ATPase domains